MYVYVSVKEKRATPLNIFIKDSRIFHIEHKKKKKKKKIL